MNGQEVGIIRIYRTYLMINLASIPIHLLFIIIMLTGKINGVNNLFGLLAYGCLLNALNVVLLINFFDRKYKRFRGQNILNFLIFTSLIVITYGGTGYFIL